MVDGGSLNKFIMVLSRHPDFGTIAADIAEALAKRPVAVFIEGSVEEYFGNPYAEVKEFVIDEGGLSFELPQALTPKSTLRPHLAWDFCDGCGGFAIRFRLPLESKGVK